jgi:hypothetical protein
MSVKCKQMYFRIKTCENEIEEVDEYIEELKKKTVGKLREIC